MDLPPDVKDEVVVVIDELRPLVPGARWVPPENLHVTLAFLGETDLATAVAGALGRAVATVPRFPSRLGAVGAFPSPRRARVVWVGLEDEASGFPRLAEAVRTALEPLGFAPESRPFTAHVTVARLKAPAPAQRITSAAPVPVAFVVDRVTLYRSRLGRPAPVYEALSTLALD